MHHQTSTSRAPRKTCRVWQKARKHFPNSESHSENGAPGDNPIFDGCYPFHSSCMTPAEYVRVHAQEGTLQIASIQSVMLVLRTQVAVAGARYIRTLMLTDESQLSTPPRSGQQKASLVSSCTTAPSDPVISPQTTVASPYVFIPTLSSLSDAPKYCTTNLLSRCHKPERCLTHAYSGSRILRTSFTPPSSTSHS